MRNGLTNSERLAVAIEEEGEDHGMMIQPFGSTGFWIIAERTEKSYPLWRLIVGHPERTSYRIVNEGISEQYLQILWIELTKLRINELYKLNDLKNILGKVVQNFLIVQKAQH